LIKIKPRQQPTVALPMGVRAQPQEGWGTVGWRLLEAFRQGLRRRLSVSGRAVREFSAT
jgi:hypothetical protein